MADTKTLREAAQAALEVLENLQGGCTDSDDGTVEAITVWCPEVCDDLRAALAAQAQGEPVAWLKEWSSVGNARTGMRRVDLTPDCETWLANMFPTITPLYAAPQPAAKAQGEQPKPRTDVVPGKVRCAVCGFSLIRTNLYVNSGTTGPGDEHCEPCPNDGNPLLPVTWEQEVREAWKIAEQMFERSHYAEVTQAQAQGEPFGHVTVRRLSKRHENHADQYAFYPAGQSPYLDNVDECHAVYLAPPPAAQPVAVPELTQAASDVLAERRRQVEVEGWTPQHDDAEHLPDELAMAASCYATADENEAPPAVWPWSWSWWKPKDRRRNLVKAEIGRAHV
jgi:hypothetical protein